MPLTPVNFSSPGYDYSADLEAIQQRKALADALMRQAQDPLQTQMMGQVAIPISPVQGLAKLAQGWASGEQRKSANEELRKLAERSQGDFQKVLAKGLRELQGTPQTTENIVDETGADANAGGSGLAAITTPGSAPDPMAAIGTFSTHPQGAALVPMAMQELQRQRLVSSLRGTPPTASPSNATGANQQPQSQSAAVGGPAGGVPLEAWLQADPSGKSYMEQLAKDYTEANKPIVGREGGPILKRQPDGTMKVEFYAPRTEPGVQLNLSPTGNVSGASAIPNYANVIGDIEGAKARAQAQYKPVTYPVGGGAERIGSAAELVQPPAPSRFPRETPSDRSGRAQDRLGILNMERQDQLAKTGKVDPELDREIAREQQRLGPNAAGTQFNRTQTTSEKAETTETGRGLGDYTMQTQKDAANAAVSNRTLQNMKLAAQDIRFGKLAPVQSNMIQWAEALGIPVSKEDRASVGSIQALTSMGIKMAGQATRASDANPSQLQFLKTLEATPMADRTKEGFDRVIAYMEDLNNLTIAKHQALTQWRQSHGGSAEGFEAQWPQIANSLPLVWNQSGGNPTASVSGNDPLGIRQR